MPVETSVPEYGVSLDVSADIASICHKASMMTGHAVNADVKRASCFSLWLFFDNIKMDLQEVLRGDIDGIELAQDRERWRALVNAVLSLRVP